jgi:hypothetical protein
MCSRAHRNLQMSCERMHLAERVTLWCGIEIKLPCEKVGGLTLHGGGTRIMLA